jgi:hypothetical protein
MSNMSLCEINEEEPIGAEEFLEKTNKLCGQGAISLQSKSHNIEEATEELIELLYPEYKNISDFEHDLDLDEPPTSEAHLTGPGETTTTDHQQQ